MNRILLAALAALCMNSAAAAKDFVVAHVYDKTCLLYTSPSPRDS